MKKQFVILAVGLLVPTTLLGCTQTQTSSQNSQTAPNSATGEVGTMQFRANGEDFVRQGFTSKDGWQINFDHVYVNFADAIAYETEPPYNAETGGEPQPKQTISLAIAKTVDLAAGDENAETILVNQVPALPGRYNALSWKMPKAQAGELAGQSMWLEGTATKNGTTVPFSLKIDQELEFVCGDFVGEERKGILQPGGTSQLEATFHFDHLFGDGQLPQSDELNTQALGFEPLAAIAEAGAVVADLPTLKTKLSEADYKTLMGILPSLGHVGEGHCKETKLANQG